MHMCVRVCVPNAIMEIQFSQKEQQLLTRVARGPFWSIQKANSPETDHSLVAIKT